MNRIALALALALAACAAPPPRPAAPVHAAAKPACALPAAPTFPDSDAALASASGLAERVARLRAGRDARVEYEQRLREACR